jgi:hypothetical protein
LITAVTEIRCWHLPSAERNFRSPASPERLLCGLNAGETEYLVSSRLFEEMETSGGRFLKLVESNLVMLKIDKLSLTITNMQKPDELRFKIQISGLNRV